MNPIQSTAVRSSIDPTAILDDASAEAHVHDVADAVYVEYHIQIGDTDVDMAALKVQESDTKTNDTTLGGTPNDVIDWDTDGDLPSATDDNSVFIIGIDMTKTGGRKRYQQLVATAGDGTAGTYISATVVIVRGATGVSELAADRQVAGAQYAA